MALDVCLFYVLLDISTAVGDSTAELRRALEAAVARLDALHTQQAQRESAGQQTVQQLLILQQER